MMGLRKLALLVRYDLKDLFASPWFYAILVMPPIMVLLIATAQPNNSQTTVLIRGEGEAVEHVVGDLREQDFRVVRYVDQEWADGEVRSNRALLAVSIDESSVVWTSSDTSYRNLSKLIIENSIDSVVLARYAKGIDEINDRKRKMEQSPSFEVIQPRQLSLSEPVEHNSFPNFSSRDKVIANAIPQGSWVISGTLAIILWIGFKNKADKIKRKYSLVTILSAKLVSGFLVGSVTTLLMIAAAVAMKVEFTSMSALIGYGLLANLGGVVSGLFFGAIPFVFSRQVVSIVFVGLMSMSMAYMTLALISGVLVPLGMLTPDVIAVTQWLPLYPISRLMEWTSLAGVGIETPIVRELLGRVLLINAVQLIGVYAVMRKEY